MTGDIKRDPETGNVAIRTTNDEATRANRTWLIATPNKGARFASNDDVADWDDLYQPGS